MATARQVVTSALKKLKVLSGGEEAQSDELTDGLSDLNDMLSGWAIDGIDLGHVTLAAGDTVDVPADHLLTVILSLAERIGGEYGAELPPKDVFDAERGRSALRALYLTPNDLSFEAGLRRNLVRDRNWGG